MNGAGNDALITEAGERIERMQRDVAVLESEGFDNRWKIADIELLTRLADALVLARDTTSVSQPIERPGVTVQGSLAEVEEFVLNTTAETDHVQWAAYLRNGEIGSEERAVTGQRIEHTFVEYRKKYGTPPWRVVPNPAEYEWVGWGFGASPELARKNLADAWAKAKAEQIDRSVGGAV